MRKGNVFAPTSLTLNAGDTVTVTNDDVTLKRHNWTQPGVFMSGDLPYAAKYSYTFRFSGSYAYECTIHQPGMNGTLTVR